MLTVHRDHGGLTTDKSKCYSVRRAAGVSVAVVAAVRRSPCLVGALEGPVASNGCTEVMEADTVSKTVGCTDITSAKEG